MYDCRKTKRHIYDHIARCIFHVFWGANLEIKAAAWIKTRPRHPLPTGGKPRTCRDYRSDILRIHVDNHDSYLSHGTEARSHDSGNKKWRIINPTAPQAKLLDNQQGCGMQPFHRSNSHHTPVLHGGFSCILAPPIGNYTIFGKFMPGYPTD